MTDREYEDWWRRLQAAVTPEQIERLTEAWKEYVATVPRDADDRPMDGDVPAIGSAIARRRDALLHSSTARSP